MLLLVFCVVDELYKFQNFDAAHDISSKMNQIGLLPNITFIDVNEQNTMINKTLFVDNDYVELPYGSADKI